jgi:hypothetical protein
VLSRLDSYANLPPLEAIDAEIERVASGLRTYLDVCREQLDHLHHIPPPEFADRTAREYGPR